MEEYDKICIDLLKLYNIRSDIRPGTNASKLKQMYDDKIKSLESIFFLSNSFTSGIELSSVNEVLKIFNSLNTDVKPKSLPKPKKSKSKSKSKSSSSHKPSASGSVSEFTDQDQDQDSDETDDPDNIEENFNELIKKSIDLPDTQIIFPVQPFTEEELKDFITVELPRRARLFNIINFDKVYTYMKILEENIQELVGPNIEAKIKFKELTRDMIVIEFIDLLNNIKIAHFTFHNKIISKYDPVGPYHLKIDDGSRRYSNLIYDKGILSMENEVNFRTNPQIMLIIQSIISVLTNHKDKLHI